MNFKKIILIGFCIFIFFPVNASADNQSDINLLIQQILDLQKKISELQNANSSGNGGSTWCHDFNNSLRKGDKSTEVGALIYALYKDGIIKDTISSANNSLYYGPITESYVSIFQQKYASEILTPSGLKKGTGFVGQATRAKLNKLFGCVAMTQNNTQQTTTTNTNQNQTATIKSNDPPQITGIYGPSGLKVGQLGTWSIGATDVESSQITYAVLWGDETVSSIPSSDKFSSVQDFSHSFLKSGTFTVNFYAKDSAGNIVSRSINVAVTGLSQQLSVSITSPNGGENLIVGETRRISWTYGGTGYIKMFLVDLNGSIGVALYDGVVDVSNGYYDVVIKSSALASTSSGYKLRIDGYNGSSAGSQLVSRDESDNYFNVSYPQTCSDSDSGINYYTKGTTIDRNESKTDFCSGTQLLTEYYCASSNNISVIEAPYLCANGCTNGACN